MALSQPEDGFDSRTRYMWKDKTKQLAARRAWYARNKDHERKNIKRRRQGLVDWLREYKKNLSCSRCVENHPACLDFHHMDGEQKEANISQAIRVKGWSKERILQEIAKCIVLCSNCHRKEHWKE
jgi:hypothetical protein